MRSYRNPFRARASEQHSDPRTFVRQFGSGVLDLLPESIWDRPLVLRSAPGGGKTSLMRLFTLDSMMHIHRRRDEFPDLVERLEILGALDDQGPTHLGVLLNLERDYRSLVDLGTTSEESIRLFLRLLDARVLVAVVRAAIKFKRLSYPEDLAQVRFEPLPDRPEMVELGERLGGLDGESLASSARMVERDVLAPLDSLIPTKIGDALRRSHTELDSLRLLSGTRLVVGQQELAMRPLVMMDDGHHLVSQQREQLLNRLADRSLDIGRWYSERFEALSAEEVMVGSIVGRDFELLELENAARRSSMPGVTSRFRYERVAIEIGNRRAFDALRQYGETDEPFSELLTFDGDEILGDQEAQILSELRTRIRRLSDGRDRYEHWLGEIDRESGYEGAIELRTLEIIVAADKKRAQRELFDVVLDDEELQKRKRSRKVREAAGLFLAREYQLPYYAGPDILAKLGSHNMEQFLALCGDQFEYVLGEITLGRRPRVPPTQQDRIIRGASERLWREIPQRLRHGRTVQRFIEAIVSMAQKETFRETAPYAPGVTGTALTMQERSDLIKPSTRDQIPGAQELFNAISSGVASNVLSVDLDYSVKNQRVMVIYLNRLVCPRFWLPLGRGGFRERSLDEMASWLADQPMRDEPIEVYKTEQLPV